LNPKDSADSRSFETDTKELRLHAIGKLLKITAKVRLTSATELAAQVKRFGNAFRYGPNGNCSRPCSPSAAQPPRVALAAMAWARTEKSDGAASITANSSARLTSVPLGNRTDVVDRENTAHRIVNFTKNYWLFSGQTHVASFAPPFCNCRRLACGLVVRRFVNRSAACVP
jgi:hypothetical protein